jgi:hypothetical protein
MDLSDMDMGTVALIVTVVVKLLLLAILIPVLWWLWKDYRRKRLTTKPIRRHRGCTPNTPTPYGSSYITDAYYYLIDELLKLEPTSQIGGVYANKPGYHNSRSQNSPYDYSVEDSPPDDGGLSTVAAAFDWTFPEAQRGDYSRISIYTDRILKSAKDPNDHRLDGWREFYGQDDTDGYVEGYDCRYDCDVTSDDSHNWHIHGSEDRDKSGSYDNKNLLLSVLRGEPANPQTSGGDGAVLLKCPYDSDRLDMLYVASNGQVWHTWWPTVADIGALWSATGIKQENLAGTIVPGTLTATWAHDESGIYVSGLGAPADPSCPIDCGNFWSYFLGRSGQKSGWGSMDKVYGQYPVGWSASRQ